LKASPPGLAVQAALVVAAAVCAPRRASASSADDLVEQARAHEAVHEDDIAVRRYNEALTIDPANAPAWLGLGALRMKLGDAGEADRVYSAALDRVPTLQTALQGRARARWALGRHDDAERDLDLYATATGSEAALRELAQWFAQDGRTPAQLATWRRLLGLARGHDGPRESEARRMVRALVILVGGADPVADPVDPDGTRAALASIGRRGG
jgi:tetratricopeptide (TPR) repeat protein